MTDELPEGWQEIMADEAALRGAAGAAGSQHRPLSKDYDLVGLIGEVEFARQFGLPLKFVRGRGDGGIDFIMPWRITIDVKTSRNADYMLVEAGRVFADVYVHAHYLEEKGRRANLLRWEWGEVVKAVTPRAYPRDIVNHVVMAEDMRPIGTLRERLMRLT